MKRILCILLSFILLMTVSALPVSANSVTDENFIRGDADSSGEVTILDATAICRALLSLIAPTYNEKAADVDCDGRVTIIDATWIQRHLAGMSSPLDKLTNDELYARAVSDAMNIEESDIMPLVNISRDDENVLWNGDRVLVAFMHKYPDSYPAGEDITLQWGDVWCVSAVEMYRWTQSNDDVTDWTERFHQLLGMPLSKGYDTITAIWVDADLLYRPAFEPDPTKPMQLTLQKTGDDAFDAMFETWFEKNTLSSYYSATSYPWTRLGYTYDWADNGTAYGLSEFIIFNGAQATVEYTYNLEDFVAYAMAQKQEN